MHLFGRLDELAMEKGHRVLRLPPYHCQYNPIAMVWSECKRYYDAKISAIHPVTSDAVLGLWKEALEKVDYMWFRLFYIKSFILGYTREMEELYQTYQ